MADENAADDLGGEDLGGGTATKNSGAKGAFTQLLKFILIGIAAVILIVTIVVITTIVLNKGGRSQTVIPYSEEYTVQRETYDWYTSLDQIRTSTSDPVPASVSVTIALGYKKDDKAASAEITARRIEIIDLLRRFFSEKLAVELRPQNEEVLRQQIRDQINDDILSSSRIRDVRFTAKDIVQQ